jgi:hypothetical protein
MRILRITLGALLAAGLFSAQAGDGRTPLPVIEKAKPSTQCVAAPDVMRRDHPAMLKHQRDYTVRGGVRGAKASLKTCVGCHASPTTASVASEPDGFCVSCHNYAAVKLDCFECHSTKAAQVAVKKP